MVFTGIVQGTAEVGWRCKRGENKRQPSSTQPPAKYAASCPAALTEPRDLMMTEWQLAG